LRKQYERQLTIAEEQQRKQVEQQRRNYNRTNFGTGNAKRPVITGYAKRPVYKRKYNSARTIKPSYAKRPVYKGSVSKPLASKSLSSRVLSNSARR